MLAKNPVRFGSRIADGTPEMARVLGSAAVRARDNGAPMLATRERPTHENGGMN
jgi:hypothetical protein